MAIGGMDFFQTTGVLVTVHGFNRDDVKQIGVLQQKALDPDLEGDLFGVVGQVGTALFGG
jgi:hypothetical protein